MTKRFIRTKAVAELLDVSPRTVEDWRATGDGPPFYVPPGTRTPMYDPEAVSAWVTSAGPRRSTSDQGGESVRA
jgi:hypothetical protein